MLLTALQAQVLIHGRLALAKLQTVAPSQVPSGVMALVRGHLSRWCDSCRFSIVEAAAWRRLEEAPATDGRVLNDLVLDLPLGGLRLPLQPVIAFASTVRRLQISSDLIEASCALVIIVIQLARPPTARVLSGEGAATGEGLDATLILGLVATDHIFAKAHV